MSEEDQKIIEKWYHKCVKVKSYYQFLNVRYYVTAILPHFEDDNTTIFAIFGEDYSINNPNWITLRLSQEELDKLDERFEIIES